MKPIWKLNFVILSVGIALVAYSFFPVVVDEPYIKVVVQGNSTIYVPLHRDKIIYPDSVLRIPAIVVLIAFIAAAIAMATRKNASDPSTDAHNSVRKSIRDKS